MCNVIDRSVKERSDSLVPDFKVTQVLFLQQNYTILYFSLADRDGFHF